MKDLIYLNNKYLLTGKSRNGYSWKYITLVRTGNYINIEEISKHMILYIKYYVF